MTSVDRAGAVVGVIALWEDKNALEASEPVVAGSRAEAVSILGGDATVETFEQVVLRLVSGRHEDRVPRRPHGNRAPIQPNSTSTSDLSRSSS